MELMINFILWLISSIWIGLATNYIYDKIKNHSYGNKGGFQVEFNIKVKFD